MVERKSTLSTINNLIYVGVELLLTPYIRKKCSFMVCSILLVDAIYNRYHKDLPYKKGNQALYLFVTSGL